jgi:hypothetical protein
METIHECRVCHNTYSKENFYKATKKKHIDKICKACKHERLQCLRKNFKQWCVDYKGGKCINCGYNKCLSALDFHHLDPLTKDFSFGSRKGTIKKEKAILELDKCILLCRNCHAEVHAGVLILEELSCSSIF